jgi:hypothetical protein
LFIDEITKSSLKPQIYAENPLYLYNIISNYLFLTELPVPISDNRCNQWLFASSSLLTVEYWLDLMKSFSSLP